MSMYIIEAKDKQGENVFLQYEENDPYTGISKPGIYKLTNELDKALKISNIEVAEYILDMQWKLFVNFSNLKVGEV
jgi:hypothetical protein